MPEIERMQQIVARTEAIVDGIAVREAAVPVNELERHRRERTEWLKLTPIEQDSRLRLVRMLLAPKSDENRTGMQTVWHDLESALGQHGGDPKHFLAMQSDALAIAATGRLLQEQRFQVYFSDPLLDTNRPNALWAEPPRRPVDQIRQVIGPEQILSVTVQVEPGLLLPTNHRFVSGWSPDQRSTGLVGTDGRRTAYQVREVRVVFGDKNSVLKSVIDPTTGAMTNPQFAELVRRDFHERLSS